MTLKKTNILLYLCISVAVSWGCNQDVPDESPVSEEEQESVEVRPEVIFGVADGHPLYHYIESQGVVEANLAVILKPRLSGFVKESGLVEGRRVQEGEILLQFMEDEWQYALKEAQNVHKRALSEYKIENRSQRTMKSLSGSNGDLIRDDSLVRIYSGLATAELNLERAHLNLSYTVMKAPFTGVLHAPKRYAPGTYLTSGTEVGELVDDRIVRVRFDVLESELGQVKPGMEAELISPGGQTLQGAVEAVSPVIDSDTKTGTVVVRVDNREQLLTPGMTVEGRIRARAESGKARIPRAAVLERDGGRTLVFKLNPEANEVEWIYVQPEAQNEAWVIVNHEDIAPGDTLAVDGHFALSHLQKVTPMMRLLEEIESGQD